LQANQNRQLLVIDLKIVVNKLIWIITIISIITYSFWKVILNNYHFPVFYIGNALTILGLALVIYLQNKKLFISFFLLCISVNNLTDELIFGNTNFNWTEIVFGCVVPIIWLLKYKKTCLINWFNKNFRNSL